MVVLSLLFKRIKGGFNPIDLFRNKILKFISAFLKIMKTLCKTLNADGNFATCYAQNIKHNKTCVPISKLANILLYYAECCPEKLQTL